MTSLLSTARNRDALRWWHCRVPRSVFVVTSRCRAHEARIYVKWPLHEGGCSTGKILQEVGKYRNGQRHWKVQYVANNIQSIEKLSLDNYSGAPDAPFKSWVMLRKHGRSSRSRSSFWGAPNGLYYQNIILKDNKFANCIQFIVQ